MDQVSWPFLATFVGDDDVAQSPMDLAAKTSKERCVSPARLQMSTGRDRRSARHDMAVGALQGVEADLEPQTEKTAHLAEEVVRSGRQQVDIRREIANGS